MRVPISRSRRGENLSKERYLGHSAHSGLSSKFSSLPPNTPKKWISGSPLSVRGRRSNQVFSSTEWCAPWTRRELALRRRGPGRPGCGGRGGARRSGRSSGRGARPRTRRSCRARRPFSPSASRSSSSVASRPSAGDQAVGRVEDEAAPGSRRRARAGRRGRGRRPASARRRLRARRSRRSRRPATGRPPPAPRGTARRPRPASSRPSKWTLSSPAACSRRAGLVLPRAGDPEVEAGQPAHRVDDVLEPLDLLQPARRGDVGARRAAGVGASGRPV